MPTEENIIVAIELGSSKVTAVAGKKNPDGVIHILAHEQKPSASFIRKGRINNTIKMTQCANEIKSKIEKKLNKTVSQAYVGIGGMGMHTVSNTETRNFGERTKVTQAVIDEIKEANRNVMSGERVILDTIPQEYRIGGTMLTNEPVGTLTESIEGNFLNIMANATVEQDVRDCFRPAEIAIAGMPISPLILADAILDESTRRSGCVFIDMGAETTSVAVYKNNILRHLAVIPLGGANVNRDITSLQIEDDEAEELKLKYGTALSEEDENEEHEPVQLRDGRHIKYEEFEGLVESRMEEIILNVNNQIKQSGYDSSQLIGGLIITGGASNMKNIDKAFEKHTGFTKLRFVKNLRTKQRISGKDNSTFNADGSFNTVLAIIDKGGENCCGNVIPTSTLFGEEGQNGVHTEDASGTNVTATATTAQGGKPQATPNNSQPAMTGTNTTIQEQPTEEPAEEPAKEPKLGGFFSKFKKLGEKLGRWVSVDDESEDENNGKKRTDSKQ